MFAVEFIGIKTRLTILMLASISVCEFAVLFVGATVGVVVDALHVRLLLLVIICKLLCVICDVSSDIIYGAPPINVLFWIVMLP